MEFARLSNSHSNWYYCESCSFHFYYELRVLLIYSTKANIKIIGEAVREEVYYSVQDSLTNFKNLPEGYHSGFCTRFSFRSISLWGIGHR